MAGSSVHNKFQSWSLLFNCLRFFCNWLISYLFLCSLEAKCHGLAVYNAWTFQFRSVRFCPLPASVWFLWPVTKHIVECVSPFHELEPTNFDVFSQQNSKNDQNPTSLNSRNDPNTKWKSEIHILGKDWLGAFLAKEICVTECVYLCMHACISGISTFSFIFINKTNALHLWATHSPVWRILNDILM